MNPSHDAATTAGAAGGEAPRKPFRILGIQQIAIGGPDKARLRRLWVDVLDLQIKSTFVSEPRTSTRTSVRSAAGRTRSRST